MRSGKWAWLVRIMIGGGMGLLACIILTQYIATYWNATPVMYLLFTSLGGAAGVATLPFADDGRTLLFRSAAHFAVTSVLFLPLAAQIYSWKDWDTLLILEGVLALLYALIWLGRWVGWYVEVMQLRTLLGLDAGPSPLKWRETLPYLPFVLLLCDGLPLLLRWVELAIEGGIIDIPVLSALFLPFVLLPVGGFFAGVSLGKRQGVCPLYPAACFVCYLPMLSVVSSAALFHCFLAAVPALAGNVLGWMYRRAIPKKS